MNDAHRVIVVIEDPERNPYELWLLAALFLSGIVFLLGLSPSPRAVQNALPALSRYLWNIQLVTGTTAVLIGMFWRQPVVARTIQIAGHVWTATGAFIYACVLFYYIGAVATLSILLLLGIAVAGLFKVLQLRRQINQVVSKVKEQHGAGTLDNTNGGDYPTST